MSGPFSVFARPIRANQAIAAGRWSCLGTLGLLVSLGASTVIGETEPVGLIVERVDATSAPAAPGLRPGDILLSWQRPGGGDPSDRAHLVHPFDIDHIDIEASAGAALELSLLRDGELVTVSLEGGAFKPQVRPPLGTAILGAYERSRADVESEDEGRQRSGISGWRQLGAQAARNGDQALATWLFWLAAEKAADLGDFEDAEISFSAAIDAATAAGWPAWVAALHHRWGHSTESLDIARATSHHREGLAIREGRFPESLAVAASLYELGASLYRNQQFAEARQVLERAAVIHRRLAAKGPALARTLSSLGAIELTSGAFPAARGLLMEALALFEETGAWSFEAGRCLARLGWMASAQGDLRAAEGYLLRAVEIFERVDSHSENLAIALGDLAGVHAGRGDMASAKPYLLRALAIDESRGDQDGIVSGRMRLGIVLSGLGDPEGAEASFRGALRAALDHDPEGHRTADCYNNLGTFLNGRDQPDQAEPLLLKALELYERQGAPRSKLATMNFNLGQTRKALGRFETARSSLLQALELYVPGTLGVAEAASSLADLEMRQGKAAEALSFLDQALAALESQGAMLGGSDSARAAFAASYAAKRYRTAVELLVELNRHREAFHVLERSRARAFLALLGERQALLDLHLPAELREEVQSARLRHDEALQSLNEVPAAADRAEVGSLRGELEMSRLALHELRVKIRSQAPRYGALKVPEPLDIGQTLDVLEPGELLLSYSIGDEAAFVFAVLAGEPDLLVARLDTDLDALRRGVTEFRDMWRPGQGEDRVRDWGERLSETILTPVAAWIARADRLIVVPDGPLHYLPLAALKDPTSDGRYRYLVEARPVSIVASATVLAELRRRPRAPGGDLVAFGDPLYPGTQDTIRTEPSLRSALDRGLRLEPLPYTRREVETLGQLFSENATIYVGPEATEGRAKRIESGTAILHIASHGLIDEEMPLESSLALTIPESRSADDDNGLLQAWEILDQMRIDADLVTLSACASALGKEMAGEGILGLTRAFQYAGARAVLASLWNVSDERTSELMVRFYGHLRQGASKDEALQRAQVSMVRDGELDASHPFFWAAFVLIGDAH